MAGLIGAVSDVVGGVVWGVGRVVLGIASEDDQHDTVADALAAPTVFEQRARVDQVLQFFERDYERFAPYVEDPERLERLRVEYYNCVNAAEFQNELISQLVDEVLDLRAQLRQSGLGARKEIVIRLAHAKLDIGDRKNKRFFKEKERRSLHEALSPLLADAQMRRLLEEQEASRRGAEDMASPGSVGAMAATPGCRGEEENHSAWSTQVESHETSGMSRRRYRRYSDEELSRLLREKDD